MTDHTSRAVRGRAHPEDHQNFRTMLTVHAALRSILQLSASFGSGQNISSAGPQSAIGGGIEHLLCPGELDQLRSHNRLATLTIREHEVGAVTTNISDATWEAMRNRGDTTPDSYPPITIYFTANPRKSKIPDDILAYDGPESYKIIEDPECDIDILSPFDWLRETWWVMPVPSYFL
jgi:hypothetical protein